MITSTGEHAGLARRSGERHEQERRGERLLEQRHLIDRRERDDHAGGANRQSRSR